MRGAGPGISPDGTFAGGSALVVAVHVAGPFSCASQPASARVAGTSAGAYTPAEAGSSTACSARCHAPMYSRLTPSPRSRATPEGAGRTAGLAEPVPLNENLGPTFTEVSLKQP